jgi:sortase A
MRVRVLTYSVRHAARPKHRAAWIEHCLWMVGYVTLGYCVFIWGRAEYDQAHGRWVLEHLLPRDQSQVATPAINSEGTLLGRIDVPRLGLSAVIFEGTSDGTLARGVGHLTGSARPGRYGNLVLAGHRDTFFRKLRGIREGDVVMISALDGRFDYMVESTAIVNSNAAEVLRPGSGATLTLITCYPFGFIGNAPQRLIVRARKVRTS